MLLKAEGKIESANALLNQKADIANKPNDLLLSLKEGKFLGLEIVSITDLPPTNINLSIRVKGIETPTPSLKLEKETKTKNTASLRANLVKNGYHNDGSAYKIYYTESYPSDYSINEEMYEDFSGSYFYKYGYSWNGDYRCTADFVFDQHSTVLWRSRSCNVCVFRSNRWSELY